MFESFEKYLIIIGVRLDEFTYTPDIVINNIEHFKSCYKDNISPYKALTMLYFYIHEK